MHKSISQILDTVAQRVIATAGDLIALTVEAASVAQQAEQLARLEDLARQCESDGKPEIAAVLRGHAQQLVVANKSNTNTAAGHGSLPSFGFLGGRLTNSGEPTSSDFDDRPVTRRRRRVANSHDLLAALVSESSNDATSTLTSTPANSTDKP